MFRNRIAAIRSKADSVVAHVRRSFNYMNEDVLYSFKVIYRTLSRIFKVCLMPFYNKMKYVWKMFKEGPQNLFMQSVSPHTGLVCNIRIFQI